MKMITKVFLVIAVLIGCLIVWALFFNDGGILQNAWNGVANSVNNTWTKITGSADAVIPLWENNKVTNVQDGVDGLEDGTP